MAGAGVGSGPALLQPKLTQLINAPRSRSRIFMTAKLTEISLREKHGKWEKFDNGARPR
jgi:hypothetical protein